MSKKITQAELIAGMVKLVLIINHAYNDPNMESFEKNGRRIYKRDRRAINAAIRHLYKAVPVAMSFAKVREIVEGMDVDPVIYPDLEPQASRQGTLDTPQD